MYVISTLCINLLSRPDRLAKVKMQFEKMLLNFERFDAISHEIGALGCTKSHIECVKLAKERNYPYCMICEDDLEFTISRKNFDKIITNFLEQPHVYILILSGNTDPKCISDFNEFFYRTTDTLTTTCYIVKRQYYNILLTNFAISERNLETQNKIEYAIDVTWKILQKFDTWLIPKICCGCQTASYSDIEKREVNYSVLFQQIYRDKYIIQNLDGGLGNRLFQVSFGYALARKTGKILLLKNKSQNAHSQINYFDNIFKKFLLYEPVIPIDNVRTERQYRALVYDNMMLSKISVNTEINGYFQNEKYFKEFATELRQIYIDDNRCESLKKKYKNIQNSVFIHVRRGDYMASHNINIHYVDLNKYYETTIQTMKSIYPNITFYIFSDDIEYCKSSSLFASINKIFIENENEIDSLHLMSLCKLGGICCNSTFSWWGSYLNDNLQKVVYFPHKWFGESSKEKYIDLGFSGAQVININTGKNGSGQNGKYTIIPLNQQKAIISTTTKSQTTIAEPKSTMTEKQKLLLQSIRANKQKTT